VYNPESDALQQLQTLELQARRLAKKLGEAATHQDRQVIERQLRETENRIENLKARLKP
jgi:hypothetical protein